MIRRRGWLPRSSVGTPIGAVLVVVVLLITVGLDSLDNRGEVLVGSFIREEAAASGPARGRAGLEAFGFAAGDKLLDGALLSGDLDRLDPVYLKACKELKRILNLNSKSSDHKEKIIIQIVTSKGNAGALRISTVIHIFLKLIWQ